MHQRRRAGRRPSKQEVPLKAGSFCSSLLLLRLKREELCLLSFLTGVWEPGCLPFSSWVVGGTLLLAFLLEFCGNRKNGPAYLTKPRWCGDPRLFNKGDVLLSSTTNLIFMLKLIDSVAAASTCLLGIDMPRGRYRSHRCGTASLGISGELKTPVRPCGS